MQLSELKPQLIIVMGGAGSGKNYFISHNPTFSKYKLIDVDQIKADIGVKTAIQQIMPSLQGAFANHENIAHPTTGSNLMAQQRKIALAKQYGYTVTLVLIDTDPARAIDQVRQRVRQGGHDVEIENIVASNKRARENYETLAKFADNSKIVSQ